MNGPPMPPAPLPPALTPSGAPVKWSAGTPATPLPPPPEPRGRAPGSIARSQHCWQRTPPVEAAPPPATPAPTPQPTPAPTPQPTPAPTTARRGATRPGIVVCQALADGPLTSTELAVRLPHLARQKIHHAVHFARRAGRVADHSVSAGTATHCLTPEGIKWLQQHTGQAPCALPTPGSPAPTDTSPPTAGEPTFRCALFSDGAFQLAKGGQSIDLTPAEYGDLVRYLNAH